MLDSNYKSLSGGDPMSMEASSSSKGGVEALATEHVLSEISAAPILAPGNSTTTALILSLEPVQFIQSCDDEILVTIRLQ